jgi:hypothetical protein
MGGGQQPEGRVEDMLAAPARVHGLQRAAAATAALLLALGALLALSAAPASAARSIAQSGGFSCANGLVKVSPPRVYADWGRTEQAFWLVSVERWNGSAWTTQASSAQVGSFNYYGQSVTSWSAHSTSRGGWYNNNVLNVPVAYQGYYRVASAVSAPGVSSAIYVAGGAYCWMP